MPDTRSSAMINSVGPQTIIAATTMTASSFDA
jgi:hypothetical protein